MTLSKYSGTLGLALTCVCIAMLRVLSHAQQDERRIEIHPIEKATQVKQAGLQPLLAEALTFINVPKARQEFNLSGHGLTAVVLDTGIRASHFDFCDRVVAQHNFTDSGPREAAVDREGHGTNVTGIIAASRANCTSGATGRHEGVAPRAGIIALKVLKDDRTGSMDWVDAGLDWVIAQANSTSPPRIGVVNMSLGVRRNYASDDLLLKEGTALKIKALRDLGIPVVVSAGNDFGAFNKQGMAYPAVIRWSTSVGAVFDANIGKRDYGASGKADKTGPGRITPFSQRIAPDSGPWATDLFAPGASILSAGIEHDADSSEQEGTSQAAPMVSGTILLMQELYLRETKCLLLPSVDRMEAWLKAGSVMEKDDYGNDDTVENTKKEFPRIDSLRTLRALRDEIKRLGSCPMTSK